MIEIRHHIPRADTLLGIVRAENISADGYAPDFEAQLRALLEIRRQPLHDLDEHRRAASRDMLRNGRYKPTGRGKPASEYLFRSAQEGGASAFPRINAPVDACNYTSLKYLVPISLWDLDLAATDRFLFRLGLPGESYVFNQGGQAIDVEDLIVGCRVDPGREQGEPIVNPVKDSLLTKTTPNTRRIAAALYLPASAFSENEALSICNEFACMLGSSSSDDGGFGILMPGETISV